MTKFAIASVAGLSCLFLPIDAHAQAGAPVLTPPISPATPTPEPNPQPPVGPTSDKTPDGPPLVSPDATPDARPDTPPETVPEPEPDAPNPAQPAPVPAPVPVRPKLDHAPPPASDLGDEKPAKVHTPFVPGNGAELASSDGKFRLLTRLRAQFRHEAVKQPGQDMTHVFMIRRARLQFKGHMWGKHNKFKVEFAVSPRDVSMDAFDTDGDGDPNSNLVRTSVLLDWFMDFTQFRDLSVRVGQSKIPYSRQRVISSGNLQLVDRSAAANAEFNLDRDLGIDIRSKDFLGLGKLRYYAGIFIGEGRNTSNRTIGAGDNGFHYLARVEFLPLGMFKDYWEADLKRSPSPKLSIALGYAYLDQAPRTRGILGGTIPNDATWDYHNATADLVFMMNGFSLFSEAFLRSGTSDTDDTPTRDGYGLMVQAGYLLQDLNLEFAARYGLNRQLGDDASSSFGPGINEIAAGVSYYFYGHPFKLQADYVSEWSQEDDMGQSDSEYMFRVQLQTSY